MILAAGNLLSQDAKSIRFQHLGINEGLSQSSVFDVVQDKYGFVWVATQDGLNKYDGKQITTFYHEQFNANTILSNTVNCLFTDTINNLLWIGTERGLNKLDFKTNKISSALLGNHKYGSIDHIVGDLNGNIWVNARKKGLVKFNGNEFKTILKDNPAHIFLNENYLVASYENRAYVINVTTDSVAPNSNFSGLIDLKKSDEGTFSLKKEDVSFKPINGPLISLAKEFKELKGAVFTTLFVNENDGWIGTEEMGLFHFDIKEHRLNNYQHNQNNRYDLSDNYIRSIYVDYAGVIWIGTDNGGLSLFDFTKQNIKYIGEGANGGEGLSNKISWAIEGDDFGNIYIGTDNGLNIFSQYNQSIKSYMVDDKKSSTVRSICLKDNFIIGTDESLYKVNVSGEALYFTDLFRGLKDSVFTNVAIYTIVPLTQDEYWLGTNKGLIRFNIKTRTYAYFNRKNSNITNPIVRVVYKANDGSWWVGTEGGLNRMYLVNDTLSTFASYVPGNNPNSISGTIVTTVVEDQNSDLWIGTYDGALNRFDRKQRKFTNFSVSDGLANNAVYGILPTDSLLWISTNRGISSFNTKNKAFRNFYESDGLQSNEFNTGAFYKTKYGELFFGGINGVSHFFPSDLRKNHAAPKLAFTNILINNNKIDSLEDYKDTNINNLRKIELNYTENNIVISFASLHYSHSEDNSYRYFIRELQDTSLIVSKNGVANYTSLSPGTYTLIVYGSNADGVWSEEPLKLKLIIHPPFWGTWLFRIAVLGLLALMVFLAIRMRLKGAKKRQELLESLVKRRTETIFQQKEEIEKQREKADMVLHKIFPDKIAEKLKNKGKVKAEHYDQATVMFTDFVSFSTISGKLKPEELVSQLNRYFKQYDKIIIRNNLVQIKTIGDAYMTAGGIPKKNKTNAVDSVLAGLQIQAYMSELSKKDSSSWKLRIGINTGEIVAGVLETKRPLYDIWGSSVNIASRVQDEGKPERVNISENTYKYIKPYFDCSARGGIMTKNVGVISMYFVNGIKKELSQNGEGIFPNKKFWSYVNMHIESTVKYKELEKDFIVFLRDNLDQTLYYHSLHHTIDVLEAVERIGLAEGVFDERMILLKTAALIHDAGFIKQYNSNEPIGVEYAKEWLPKYGYNKEQIDKISQLILATNVSNKPKNKLERIIKDADLDYLGRDDFKTISDKLFQELNERGIVETKEQWDKMQVKFFDSHIFYTDYAKNNRLKKKLANKPQLAIL